MYVCLALLKDDEFLKPSASALPAFINATLNSATTDLLVTPSVTPPSSPQSESLNVSVLVTLSCIPQQSTVVTSPGYPSKYKNDVSYHVTVRVDAGHVVRLTFEFFNIEEEVDCLYDSIQVYDGASITAANLTEKLCGRDIPQPITSTTNVMHIHFQTDYSVRKRGFQAVAECV
ncbi:Tolloid-like protein 1 [Holothuria leucospilota]|uniref:Tolloid-like protein 1 n=1 Tax=Holothuria leucospilota TaxID=206669 RepID=A0A9Q1CQR9_HOLLE|nr:Tolloid-like protein 1 [Holothuria leucospilota]